MLPIGSIVAAVGKGDMIRDSRNEVVIIVPPNTNTVVEGRLLTVTRPQEHSDWSDFLCLGPLSLVCALHEVDGLRPLYIDGTIIDLDEIVSYITDNAPNILAVCVGVLTANYEAGLLLLEHAKQVDPAIVTVVGNDHFTALPTECMERRTVIDFGFVGNEVVGPFTHLMQRLRDGAAIATDEHPGLVFRTDHGVAMTPQAPESVFSAYRYGVVDEAFDHSSIYRAQFRSRIAPRLRELTGKTVTAGVPVDLGRGCIKFAKNDACTFCSIQFGGMWRNQLTPGEAWATIHNAWTSGYDYLYLTADELPLTFAGLLSAMHRDAPDWWRALDDDDRPALVGYARADGVADAKRTEMLRSMGVRQVMIGMDAGSAVSLAAMNKVLRGTRDDFLRQADALYAQNWQALEVARETGMLIRAGFVMGHIGLTRPLLEENVERITALLDQGKDVISAIDIEVLSPQPGSFDFTYLVEPETAAAAAQRVGLEVASDAVRTEIASHWQGSDVVQPELAMRDYAAALMPDVTFDDLASARTVIRDHAKSAGVVIGE